MATTLNPSAQTAFLQIQSAFQELAAQFHFLTNHELLDADGWLEAFIALDHARLARDHYLQGQYQLALDALPEF